MEGHKFLDGSDIKAVIYWQEEKWYKATEKIGFVFVNKKKLLVPTSVYAFDCMVEHKLNYNPI